MTDYFKYTLNGRDRYLNLAQVAYADEMGPSLMVTTPVPGGAGQIQLYGEDAERLRQALRQRVQESQPDRDGVAGAA